MKKYHCGFIGDVLKSRYIKAFGEPFQVDYCPACGRYIYSAKKKNGMMVSRIEDIDPEVVSKFIENVITERQEKFPHFRKAA